MPRGKSLLELMDARELERKRGPRGAAPEQHALPAPPRGEAPQDLWSRIIGLRHSATRVVRRFFIAFATLLFVMLLHAYEPFRVRAAILIGTTSSSDPVRALSVAVPLAVAASVLLAWAA
jgi:hypothetical protein